MQLNYAAASYRLHGIAELLAEINARPDGIRKTRMFDLEAELRDLRVEEVFNVDAGQWRWAVRTDNGHAITRDGLRVWEPELRREERLELVRFPNREEAQAALQKYLDAL